VKVTLPPAPVVTFLNPKKVCPSPKPVGSIKKSVR
jgi:hypothetical protein